MLWNGLLTNKLPAVYQPDIFWHNIPVWVGYGENISRGLVFLMAFLIPLPTEKLYQITGFWIYLIGLALYFIAWILLIDYPDSAWSKSLLGFMAPAYTPLLWLTGIALTGKSFYFKIPYRAYYFILASLVFLSFHCFHTWLVWERLQ
ncbi:hypothetical protein GCM10027442_26210 [Emticicia fontis]